MLSGVRLSRFYLPEMTAKKWGRIVFISSESGVNTPTEMIHYGLTKTAQLALSRGLAQTAAGTGVTVNTVMPGPTKSEGVGTFVEQMAQGQGHHAGADGKRFLRARAAVVAAQAVRDGGGDRRRWWRSCAARWRRR